MLAKKVRWWVRDLNRRCSLDWFQIASTIVIFIFLVPALTWFTLLCLEFNSSTADRLLFQQSTLRFVDVIKNETLFPTFHPEPEKRHRIALCAKIDDEVPYLVEWIEFHRLQGIDKFDLYSSILPGDPHNVHSNIDLTLVQSLYNQIGLNDLIEIVPTASLNPDASFPLLYEFNDTVLTVHRMQQHAMLSHCAKRNRDLADWMLHVDVDEFVYAPASNLWSFLHGKGRHLSLRQSLEPRHVAGYSFPPINFGISGMMFDLHTRLVADVATGKVQLIYDPRDSSAFRAAHATEPDSASAELDWIFRNAPADATAEQLSILRQVITAAAAQVGWHHLEFIHEMELILQELQADSTNGFGRLTQRFAQQYDNKKVLPLIYNISSHGNSGFELSQQIDSLYQQAKLRKASLNVVSSNAEVLPGFLSRSLRQQISEQLQKHWSEYYPMITLEQMTTAPNAQSISFQDILSTGTAQMRLVLGYTLFQECRGKKLPAECSELGHSRPASWMTRMGKTIYRTNTMFRSELDRRSNRFSGCLLPWVHRCTHLLDTGEIYEIKPHQGVRLDHHQFRSLERRTTKLPTWRGGPIGYADKFDFIDWIRWFQLVPDSSKFVLGLLVRQRIFQQFQPIPKFFQYNRVRTASGSTQFHPTAVLSECSAIELSSEAQVPCPRTHPYVGVVSFGDQSPSPRIPYFWCTDIPRNATDLLKSDIWTFTYNNWFADEDLDVAAHTQLCPGWPESRCCNSMLPDNTSVWDSNVAVLVTDKYERWHSELNEA